MNRSAKLPFLTASSIDLMTGCKDRFKTLRRVIGAKFRCIADPLEHAVHAEVLDQGRDLPQFMHALQVRETRRIPGCRHRVDGGSDQREHPPAEDGLLAEEIRFSLIADGGLDDRGSVASDPGRPFFRQSSGIACRRFTRNGQQAGDSRPFDKSPPKGLARSLRGHHHNPEV